MAAAGLAAVGLVTGLSACGSAAAGAASHGAGGHAAAGTAAHRTTGVHAATAGSLCSQTASLDTVTVTRTLGLRPVREPLPTGFTIRDAAAVRSLARALCALPVVPAGVLHCPADFGGSFRLVFARAGHPFPAVSVATTGCRTVTGLGRARWWAKTAGFWPVMGRALSAHHTMIPG
ncbi:MAG TPA: hypothetical protein VGS19_31710 [Streptosporangiaceae bacterium]|nr:hypothetical protein [Streptosporangiaceae bacterium]